MKGVCFLFIVGGEGGCRCIYGREGNGLRGGLLCGTLGVRTVKLFTLFEIEDWSPFAKLVDLLPKIGKQVAVTTHGVVIAQQFLMDGRSNSMTLL